MPSESVSSRRAPPAPATAALLTLLYVACASVAGVAVAADRQQLYFRAPAAATDPATPAAMRSLAERALPVYQDSDREQFLRNLSALQAVAGEYGAASATRQSLREMRRGAKPAHPEAGVIYDMYVRAKASEAKDHVPFEQAYALSFRDVVGHLSDREAYTITRWLGTPPAVFQDSVQRAFDELRSDKMISLEQAVALVSTYLSFEVYRAVAPLVPPLVSEDDERRYVSDDNVQITTGKGTSVSALVVRPKSSSAPLPALLEFTIHVAPQNYAKECAANGYVGVVAYARGKRGGAGTIVPFEHDGDDARAVITWIARQSWSDGRVAMYGTGYSAFVAWAAAKRAPPALKAFAASGTLVPGINWPMSGNIFLDSSYRWLRRVTQSKDADAAPDDEHARALDQSWYQGGKPYRELDRAEGGSDAAFQRWLNHPSYDQYWQKMLPYRKEFAHVNIPILATTGYFDWGALGALFVYAQDAEFNPHSDQLLLIGPYEHGAIERGVAPLLRGYALDPAALVNLRELRYQWFDYVLKSGARPGLLKERVNYEVMGANEWRHAPSLQAMGNRTVRLYLDGGAEEQGRYRLVGHEPTHERFVEQKINLADRSDAEQVRSDELLTKSLDLRDAVAFVSGPMRRPIEFNGRLAGQLSFVTNKHDMDVAMTLYELRPSGEYLQLFAPAYRFRASYLEDRSRRHLLVPGRHERLAFKSDSLTSVRFQAGSRLVMVLGIVKQPGAQLDYGTGKDVSEESLGDARVPLDVKWSSSSFIDLPARR